MSAMRGWFRRTLGVAVWFVATAVSLEVDANRKYMKLSKAEYDSLIEIPILSPVPVTGGWDGGATMRVAAEMAMDIINSQQILLPGYRLNTSWFDDECNADNAVKIMAEQWNNKDYAALGANGCSTGCQAAALLAPQLRIPHISYACSSSLLSDTTKYPDFGRLATSEGKVADVYRALAIRYKWKDMVIITGDSGRFDGPAKDLLEFFKQDKFTTMKLEWLTPRNPNWDDLKSLMERVKRSSQRVVVVFAYVQFYRRLLCAAIIAGIPKGMVYLSFGWHTDGWWAEDEEETKKLDVRCTKEAITEQYNGGIGAAALGRPLLADMQSPLDCLDGYSSETFRELLTGHFKDGYPYPEYAEPSPHGGFEGNGADGICVWAYMFKYMFAQGYSLSELIRPAPDVYKKMRNYIKNDLSFFGIAGQIQFDGNDVAGILAVRQVQEGKKTLVSTMSWTGTTFDAVAGTKLYWGDASNPDLEPKSSFDPCDVGFFRDAEGICQTCPKGQYFYQKEKYCQKCPQGKYNELEGEIDDVSCKECAYGEYAKDEGSSSCVKCDPGTFSNNQEGRGVNCVDCPEGTFQEHSGKSECIRCDLGTYQHLTGAMGCDLCPDGRTTRFLSAPSIEDCVCPSAKYEPYPVDLEHKYLCTTCPLGMSCDEDSRLTDWFTSISQVEETADSTRALVYPKLMKQYYATSDKPVYVYRCLSDGDCPGGDPGTCAGDREGFACGRCKKGYYNFGGRCNQCNSIELTTVLFPILPFVVGPLATVFLYTRLLGPADIRKLDSPKMRSVTLAFFILLHFQTLGIIRQFNLVLPSVRLPWEVMGMANSGVQFLRPECAGGGEFGDFSVQFVLRSALPLFVGANFIFAYFALRGITRFTKGFQLGPDSIFTIGMERDATINAFGTIMYTFSIAVLAIAFDLFKCFPHPNGESSLRVSPDVLCDSDQWLAMLGIGILAILVYFVASFSLFSYTIYIAPRSWHDPNFRLRWKFLFNRWRPDRWWFGQVFLLKGVSLNLTLVIFTSGALQVIWMGLTLIVYAAVVILVRPWRHAAANALDGIVTLALLSISMCCVYFAERTSEADNTLDKFLITFTSMPILAVVAFAAPYVFWWYTNPEMEVKLAVNNALDAERVVIDIAKLDSKAFLRGTVCTTSDDRNQMLCALRFLLAEGTCQQTPGKSRLLQRESSHGNQSKVGAEKRTDISDATLHKKFQQWCHSNVGVVEQHTKRIFGDMGQLGCTDFAQRMNESNDPMAQYAAELLDMYEEGFVVREVFETFVRRMGSESSTDGSLTTAFEKETGAIEKDQNQTGAMGEVELVQEEKSVAV